jgi:hypothetical protein
VLRLFSDPLIAADGGDAEDVELLGLQKDQDGLLIAGARATGILVDDDFDSLGISGDCKKNECRHDERGLRMTRVH